MKPIVVSKLLFLKNRRKGLRRSLYRTSASAAVFVASLGLVLPASAKSYLLFSPCCPVEDATSETSHSKCPHCKPTNESIDSVSTENEHSAQRCFGLCGRPDCECRITPADTNSAIWTGNEIVKFPELGLTSIALFHSNDIIHGSRYQSNFSYGTRISKPSVSLHALHCVWQN